MPASYRIRNVVQCTSTCSIGFWRPADPLTAGDDDNTKLAKFGGECADFVAWLMLFTGYVAYKLVSAAPLIGDPPRKRPAPICNQSRRQSWAGICRSLSGICRSVGLCRAPVGILSADICLLSGQGSTTRTRSPFVTQPLSRKSYDSYF